MSNDEYPKDQIRKDVQKGVRKGVKKVLVPVFFALFAIFVVAPLFGLVVQLLWNATITQIFELDPISYWQAIGLFILAKFFFGFGGSSGSSKGKSSKKRRDGPPSGDEGFKAYWKNEGKDAWEAFQAGKSEGDTQPEAQ